MRMSEIQELLDTMESLRAKHCPDLPAALIQQLIEIQHAHLDDPGEANKRIVAAVERYLAEGGANG